MPTKITMSAKNKAFWKKPKNEQRIAIAKDVLKQLDSKQIRAKEGVYFRVKRLKKVIMDAPPKLDSLLNIFKREKAVCDVCGIGACFFSLVKIGDNVKTNTFIGNSGVVGDFDEGDTHRMRTNLRKIFSSEQITMIECAFEKDNTHTDRDYVDGFKRANSAAFGEKYKSDTTRLKAIMNNIIINKGIFIP